MLFLRHSVCILSINQSINQFLHQTETIGRPNKKHNKDKVVYRSLNGTAPSYLAADLRRLSDMPSMRRLRSSLTHQLDVRQSQCATVGDRTFATAGARLWNSLPADIVSCDILPHFRRELKTFLFRQSYPSILLYFFTLWTLRFLLRPR